MQRHVHWTLKKQHDIAGTPVQRSLATFAATQPLSNPVRTGVTHDTACCDVMLAGTPRCVMSAEQQQKHMQRHPLVHLQQTHRHTHSRDHTQLLMGHCSASRAWLYGS